jgi:hypothetical protein
MNDDVDTPSNRRHHEPAADVLPRQQRQRAHLGNGLTRRVRMNRAHAWNPRIQCNQQIEAFLLANLADNDALRGI